MKPKLRVVFDTNIYISAIIFGGNPRQCLELGRTFEIELFCSKAILLELAEKLQNKFKWSGAEVMEIIGGLSRFVHIFNPQITIDLIKNDPSDNRILEAASEIKADYMVSGDKKHLLSLTNFQDIPIRSAKQFLEIYYN